VGVLKTG